MTDRHATIMASLVLLAVLVRMVLVVRHANASSLMHTVAIGRNPRGGRGGCADWPHLRR